LPMLLADEMDADWSQVVAELAPAADIYRDPVRGIQMVGGSGSIATSFQQYRELGARTRGLLVAAAAERWKVAPDQCHTEASVVRGPAGQSAKYAELATDAARIPVPTTVSLKKPADFRLVGTRVRRLDSRNKCDGSQRFGLDLDLPGMKVALVAHPPVFGARPQTIDDQAARSIPGVVDVFQIPTVSGGTAVAVVADKFWTAKQARDSLRVEWDLSTVERADSAQLWATYKQLAGTPGNVAVTRGDQAAIDRVGAGDRLVAEYAKRARGTPVKLIWTREDDVQGGYYRPMHAHRVEVGVGSDGLPVAWRHVVVGQSIVAGTPFAAFMVRDGVDRTAVEGAADTHYAIPNFHLSVHHPKVNVPVLWWRSVGHTHTAFVMETLIDELAT